MARQCLFGCVRIFLMGLNVVFMNTCWLGVDSGSYFACIALSVLLAHSVAGTVAMETRVTCHVSQLSGLALLALSVWMHFDRAMLMRLSLLQLPSAPSHTSDQVTFTLMALGGCVALVSFLGCCGAWTESACFLCLYSTLLMFVVLAQIISGVFLAIFHYKAEKLMYSQLRYDYNRTGLPDFNQSNPVTIAWDRFQIEMKCCGSSGPQDYALSNWHNATRRRSCAGSNHGNVDGIGNHGNHGCPLDMPTIPASCCADQVDYLQCQIYYAQSRSNPNFITDSFHSEGCYSVLMTSVNAVKWYLIGLSVGILLLQVLNVLLTCALMAKIRAEDAKYPPLYYTDDDELLSLRDVYNAQRSIDR